jgi:hypothetical protein
VRLSASELLLFSFARADEPKLVIVDNDFTGPPDTLSDLRSALMFLKNPNFKVLGFTVVTGDGWRNEEVAHLLRLEEIVSRCDVPVIPGAVTPLVNTLQDKQAWEKRYPEKKKKVSTGEHGTLRKIGPGSPSILRTIQTSFRQFQKACRASFPVKNWHRNS